MRSRRSSLAVSHLAALLLPAMVACGADFTEVAAPTVAVVPTGDWRDTMSVKDIVTVSVRLMSAAGDSLLLGDVRWVSSDTSVVAVRGTFLTPPLPTLHDSLAHLLTVRLEARRRGSATINVAALQPGFLVPALNRTIVVRERWVAVSAGGAHTCAINSDGEAFCWGVQCDMFCAKQYGVGAGPVDPTATPLLVHGGRRYSSISAGGTYTCAVETPSKLAYCWGSNSGYFGSGMLGTGSNDDAPTPERVVGGRVFNALVAGDNLTCGVAPGTWESPTQQGKIATGNLTYCWGASGSHGLAGRPQDPLFGVISNGSVIFPIADVRDLSVGTSHACGIYEGRAYCWGINGAGQLGSSVGPATTIAVPVETGLGFTRLSTGALATCGLTAPGALYCWGYGEVTPAAVHAGVTFVDLDARSMQGASGDGTCAITGAGTLYCGSWPIDGPAAPVAPPVDVHAGHYTSVAVGEQHQCILAANDGAIFCRGFNDRGALGAGNFASRTGWVRVVDPP